MTSMYYAYDDTEEKYGWDLNSPRAPPVPQCVSRKYRVTWKRASKQTRKNRVEDYAAFMMEKEEDEATKCPTVAGILSLVDRNYDSEDKRSIINAVKDEVRDEVVGELAEKLEEALKLQVAEEAANTIIPIRQALEAKIEEVAEEVAEDAANTIIPIRQALEAKIEEVAEDTANTIEPMKRVVEKFEAKAGEVADANETMDVKDVGRKNLRPTHIDTLEWTSSNGPTSQLDIEGAIDEDEEYFALQSQSQSQSQSQYYTCRYTPSQKPKLSEEEIEAFVSISIPKPKAWDHGWESE